MRLIVAFLVIFSIYAGINPSFSKEEMAYANTSLEVPPYAKWGKIAMQKTKEKYPNADIIDYLHVGRKKGEQTSVETFHLWLKEDQKEFGIKVDIEFTNETERVINISFKEIPA
ncbi:MAG: YqzG/YhdC family protein [Bacillota bacterium]